MAGFDKGDDAMLAGVLGILIGFCVAHFVARKVADAFPSWPGVATGIFAGSTSSTVVALVVAFGGAYLIELNGKPADMQWYTAIIAGGFWLSLPGGIWGGLRGRKSGKAHREALEYEARRNQLPTDLT